MKIALYSSFQVLIWVGVLGASAYLICSSFATSGRPKNALVADDPVVDFGHVNESTCNGEFVIRNQSKSAVLIGDVPFVVKSLFWVSEY